MTFTIKSYDTGKHHIAITQDKSGIIFVTDAVDMGGVYYRHKNKAYLPDEMKKATATYNRYCKLAMEG